MSRNYLVRVGAMAHVGNFAAVDAASYPRGAEVIVRTRRGLEIGEVLTPPDLAAPQTPAEGDILRSMSIEDHLLKTRLEKNRDKAFDACLALLAERQIDSTLLDVELLFDGSGLFFYFLGEVSPQLADITDELAETYETKVQLRQFTETLTAGCGPDCGTENASGGGCASCATGCSIASVCGSHKSAS